MSGNPKRCKPHRPVPFSDSLVLHYRELNVLLSPRCAPRSSARRSGDHVRFTMYDPVPERLCRTVRTHESQTPDYRPAPELDNPLLSPSASSRHGWTSLIQSIGGLFVISGQPTKCGPQLHRLDQYPRHRQPVPGSILNSSVRPVRVDGIGGVADFGVLQPTTSGPPAPPHPATPAARSCQPSLSTLYSIHE